MNAIDRVRKARASLLLDRPFYGALTMAWDLKEDPGCKTFWTDGKGLGFNPQYVEETKDHVLKGILAQ